jgi:predicted nucleic acid-binding protein
MDFGDDLCGLENMFEHCLDPRPVNRAVGEWQMVTVGDDRNVLGRIEVRADKIDVAGFIESACAAAFKAAADDQHAGAGLPRADSGQEAIAILRRDRIAAENDGAHALAE